MSGRADRVANTSLIDSLHEPIFVVGPDETLLYANERLSEITTLPAEEFENSPLTDLTPFVEAGFADLREGIDAILRKDATERRVDVSMTHPDDTPVDARISAEARLTRLTDEDGLIGVLVVMRDITEQKEIEQQLRASESLFRAMFEAHSAPMLLIEPQSGNIEEANVAAAEFYGYSVRELTTMSIQQINCRSPSEVAAERRRARAQDRNHFEFKHELASGEVRTVEVHSSPIEVDDRELLFSIIHDITERKRREREYEQIFNSVNDAIIAFDPDAEEITQVNDAYKQMFGYNFEQIRELGVGGLSVAEEGYTANRGWELIREVAETGQSETTEWRGETSAGDRIWLEVTLTPAEIGGEQRVLSIQRDVTERKRRQREYEQIFNSVNEIIAVRDAESGKLVDVNESYAELLGYDREEMRGMPIGETGIPEEGYDDERGMEYLTEVLNSDEPVEFEWKVEGGDGRSHPMEVRGTAAEINGEQRYLAIGREITERKRRERAIGNLQEATDRLQTATTLEEVATIAVETASDVLDLPMAICWFHNEDSEQLEPAAATASVHDAGLVSDLSPGRYEYDIFTHGSVTEYTPSEQASDNPLETGVLLPLGEYGLLAAGTREDVRADAAVLDIAKALADHVMTALERVKQAQAVRESERRFRMIAERIDEVIYVAEPDFSEVLYVNPAYSEIWGRPVDELEDNPRAFIEAADDRDQDRLKSGVESMVEEIRGGEPDDSYDFEYRIRQPDGEIRWVHGTGYAVEQTDDMRRFVGIVEDITERKHREQRLEVFNRILRHNLRNKLDVIRSHAEELADRTAKDHAERIMDSVDELAVLGGEAREIERVVSMENQPTEVQISETLKQAIEAVAVASEDVQISTDIPTRITLTTNKKAVEIAVESALENAIEHAESEITVKVSSDQDRCVVSIEDDGPGIPEAQLTPIEKGTETRLQHGRGLGIWQIRWCVDKLNGELSFDTSSGTTVRITFPDQRD